MNLPILPGASMEPDLCKQNAESCDAGVFVARSLHISSSKEASLVICSMPRGVEVFVPLDASATSYSRILEFPVPCLTGFFGVVKQAYLLSIAHDGKVHVIADKTPGFPNDKLMW